LTIDTFAAPLRIFEDAIEAVRAHAARTYPDECCGALLGKGSPDGDIVRAIPLVNESTEPHAHRFLISPDVVRSVERLAEAEQLHLVGFYHSHPDAAAVPSSYDNEHAVSWLLSIIVRCTATAADTPRAYAYDMNARRLVERSIEILPAALA
jgi:proteasome lid subunit RPN8/RPN11